MKRPLLLALLLILTPWFTFACDESETEPAKASLYFIHSIPELGSLEIMINDKVLTTLKSGELTGAHAIPSGSHTLSLRAPGAQSPLHSEYFSFAPQAYLFAFTGNLANLNIFKVDAWPPSLSKDQSAIEIVVLYDTAARFDIYVGTTLIAENIGYLQVSDFATIPTSSPTVKVHNHGDNPSSAVPVAALSLNMSSKRAYMVIVQRGAGGMVDMKQIEIK